MSEKSVLDSLSPAAARRIDQACDRFESAWKFGQRPRPDDYVVAVDEPERSGLLRQLLLLDWEYRRRAGDEPSAADYHTRFPDDSAVVEGVGSEMTAHADNTRLRANGFHVEHTPWSDGTPARPVKSGTESASDFSRYDLLEEIGHGGIGVVYRGRDGLLGRELAVKVLRENYRDNPEARRRFINEARIGSRLQHPAIVPVYELGSFADGRPYFTMKLVEGHTLAAMMQDRADPTEDRPRLLGIFEQVCQAMAYAHAGGFIHRDLKPHNVMVGSFGEVQVMDWGFAKVLQTDEGGRMKDEADNCPLHPSSFILHPFSASQSGILMGTPAYMPPEQARGEADRIDARADVFALGAILCEILTGRPPYTGETADEICRKAATGDLNDAFARLDGSGADEKLRDLAGRCLAADLAARPAAAALVARDLTAYRASAQERLRQAQLERAAAEARAQEAAAKAKAERHARRLTLGLAAAVLVLILGAAAGPFVGLVLLRAEQKQTEEERQAAVAAREEEARRRQQARQALDLVAESVIEEWLERQPEPSEEHKKFLERMLAAYQEFASETATDEASRAGLAGAYLQTGDILYLLGRMRESEEAIDRTVTAYSELVSGTGRLEYRRKLMRSLSQRAVIWHDLGRGEQAVEALRDLVRMQRDLVAASADPDDLSDLGRNLTVLGGMLDRRGEVADAEAVSREAVAIHEKLIGEQPARVSVLLIRANKARANLGVVLDRSDRHDEAEQTYRDALTSLARLAPGYQNQRDVRQLLGAVHTNLGALLHQAGRLPQAEASHRTALDIRRQLVADFPARPALRGDLAMTYHNLGVVRTSLNRREDAVKAYREAIAAYEKLVAEVPKEVEYRSGLAKAQVALGSLLYKMDLAEEAEAASRASARLYQELVATDPAVPDYRHHYAGSLVNLAWSHHQRGEWIEARRLLEEALPHHQAAIQAKPLYRHYRQFLCTNRFHLGNTYLAEKDHTGLAKAADQLAEAAEAGSFPLDLARAGAFLGRCATLAEQDAELPDGRRAELSQSYAERAVTSLRLAVKHGYRDAAKLKGLSFASLQSRPDFQELLAGLERSEPKP
jgi:tetratricopeptide (TPR) repeat protein/tRNA A-37 threonylcarbamoyl transferase component Bud32